MLCNFVLEFKCLLLRIDRPVARLRGDGPDVLIVILRHPDQVTSVCVVELDLIGREVVGLEVRLAVVIAHDGPFA